MLFLFLNVDMVPKNSTPVGFAYIWKRSWVGKKTERAQIHSRLALRQQLYICEWKSLNLFLNTCSKLSCLSMVLDGGSIKEADSCLQRAPPFVVKRLHGLEKPLLAEVHFHIPSTWQMVLPSDS